MFGGRWAGLGRRRRGMQWPATSAAILPLAGFVLLWSCTAPSLTQDGHYPEATGSHTAPRIESPGAIPAPAPTSKTTRRFLPLILAPTVRALLPLSMKPALPSPECVAGWPASAAAVRPLLVSGPSDRVAAAVIASVQEKPPPFRFEEVSAAAGVAAVTYTWGLAWGDFDDDGDEDLFLSNHGSPPHLFVNQSDGTFVESAEAMSIPPGGRDGHGTAWGDYDGDGDLDLLIVQGKKLGQADRLDQLYRNDGEAGFVLATEEAGVGNPGGRARSASWIDYDRDGDLDLLTVNFQTPSVLFVNDGQARFEPLSPFVSDDAGYWDPIGADGAAWSDYDLDGDLDLFLSGLGSRLLQQEAGRFRDVTAEALGAVPRDGTGAAWGDYDNDGDPDLYLTRGYGRELDYMQAEGRSLRLGGTTGSDWEGADFVTIGGVVFDLYRNGAHRSEEVYIGQAGLHSAELPLVLMVGDPRACGEPPDVSASPAYRVWRDCPGNVWHLRWRGESPSAEFSAGISLECELRSLKPTGLDLTTVPWVPSVLFTNSGDGTFSSAPANDVIADPGNSRGVAWLDADNDGWLDLFVVNNGDTRTGNGVDRFYHNLGNGRFVEVGRAAGVAGDGSGRGGAVAWADYDRDGWLDLLVTNGYGPPPGGEGPHRLYANRGGFNHWLEVRLVDGQGGLGNGARVVLWAGEHAQTRQQTGGASLFSQNSQVLHFGLGQATLVDRLIIEWPSGRRQELEQVTVDQLLVVREEGE